MTVSQLPATALPADSGGLTNRLVGSFKATASETPKVMAYEAAATDMSHKPILGVFVFRRYASTRSKLIGCVSSTGKNERLSKDNNNFWSEPAIEDAKSPSCFLVSDKR